MYKKICIRKYHEFFQCDELGLVRDGEGEGGGGHEDEREEKPGSCGADLDTVWLHDDLMSVQGYGHVSQGGHVDSDAGQGLHQPGEYLRR